MTKPVSEGLKITNGYRNRQFFFLPVIEVDKIIKKLKFETDYFISGKLNKTSVLPRKNMSLSRVSVLCECLKTLIKINKKSVKKNTPFEFQQIDR